MKTGAVVKRLRAVRETTALLIDNPSVVRELVRTLPPFGRAANTVPAFSGDHTPPVELASYDRTAAAVVDSTGTPEQARALLGDLSVIPEWLTMHAAWRGAAPGRAEVGVRFTEQVKLMGIPAEIAWTVITANDTMSAMTGKGPMGLTIGLWFCVTAHDTGCRIWVDAGIGGDPIKGPMGASVAKNVQDALHTSLLRLAALIADGRAPSDGTGRAGGGAPVLHVASGRMLDPRTPVIVGAGQLVQRDADLKALRDPVALSVEALKRAETDAGASGLLARADAVFAVASTSWTYRDQAALVASGVGAKPSQTVMSAKFGGDAGQLLVNVAGEAIAQGNASVVLVCGAEAGATMAAAQKAGVTPTWPEQSRDVAPTLVLGIDREANNEAEANAGLGAPVYTYALIESAVRHRLNETVSAHQKTITRLWSGLSDIASANEFAWQPQAFSPDERATADQNNRMVSSPYPKLLCANLQVDLASGLILTSVAAATAAGVAQHKWVFLHAGAAAHDEWFVSERGDLAASPALRTIGEAALTQAGISINDVKHVDLYSCFPAAVQIAALDLGLPVNDASRPLSVTGGLTFAGGPGNNYGGHAVATLVGRLRDDPGSFGLSTSLGWYLTKHAIGIYSTQPPSRGYESLHPIVQPVPTRAALTDYTGAGGIEAYTVQYQRDGEPEAAIVSVLTPHGARMLVRTAQPELIAAAVDTDLIGRRVEVLEHDQLTLNGARPVALPPPPPMPVLVERRGAVTVITLNRPERRNAIDLATAQLLERIIDAFEADPAARVAVLTGTGGTFCAGMDLQSAATGQFALTEKRGPLGIAGPPISKPVIAAVEGHALAGGCELALVADLIVASNESEFGIPEAKRGLVAAAGGALRLSQRLPRNIAMELALTGKPMSAVRLAELGLVNRLADPGKVLDAALELAAEITANAPLSLQASKQIIDGARDWSTTEEFQNQTDIAAAALLSEDAREGVAAFAEHREPVWTGR